MRFPRNTRSQPVDVRSLSRLALAAGLLFVATLLPSTLCAQRGAWASRELRDGHTGQVEGVAFSPDGKWLASADNDGTLIVRPIGSEGEPWRSNGRNFTEVAWSADGRTLVAGGFDSLVYVWRWPEGTRVRLLHYPGQVEAIAVTRGGVILAAGGGDRTIRRWTLPALKELPSLNGHHDDIYTVKVSPDDRLILSSGKDRTIRIWEVTTGRALRVLQGARRQRVRCCVRPGRFVVRFGVSRWLGRYLGPPVGGTHATAAWTHELRPRRSRES